MNFSYFVSIGHKINVGVIDYIRLSILIDNAAIISSDNSIKLLGHMNIFIMKWVTDTNQNAVAALFILIPIV